MQPIRKWRSTERFLWVWWVILCTLGWTFIEGVIALKGIASLGPTLGTTHFLGTSFFIFLQTSLFLFVPFLLVFVLQSIILKECLSLSMVSLVLWTGTGSIGMAFLLTHMYHYPFSRLNTVWYILVGLNILFIQCSTLKIQVARTNKVLLGVLTGSVFAIIVTAIIPEIRIATGFIYGSISGLFIVHERFTKSSTALPWREQ